MTTSKSTNRRALVTGGSGDIGGAICRALADAGHRVYVHAHANAERAAEIVAAIQAGGGIAEVVVFDITDAAATHSVLEALLQAGPIYTLVHNSDVSYNALLARQAH